jgi:UDP-N-acetylglucosamine 1-carboxyvinyltransferase
MKPMHSFLIEGGHPLRGEVTPAGNKNAALPLLAACLLSQEPVVLHNVPDIGDVRTMRALIESLGVEVTPKGPHTWQVHARQVRNVGLDPDMCRRIRASILLAGSLLGRNGEAALPLPGGDFIGRRRIDTHLLALEAYGVQTEFQDGTLSMRTPGRLAGSRVLLDEASVTATENAILAAVTARGRSEIRNAASEPHVQDLCHMLRALGGRIENIGSNTLIVEGVEALHGGEYTIGSDYLEVVSYIGAAAVTGGEIRIRNAAAEHLEMVRLVFRRLGITWEVDDQDILVPPDQALQVVPDLRGAIPQISVMPWPAFPTDLMSLAIVLATQSHGTVLFHDWMFEGRMFFIDKLTAMGARIVLCDPHRSLVQGPSQLVGETLESPDIRAGLALVMAALAAQGTSRIRNIGQIERGYERIDEKLQAMGAVIRRVEG